MVCIPCEYCSILVGDVLLTKLNLWVDELLCPNFVGSLDAPTTAKCGAEKNPLAAASVAILINLCLLEKL